MFSSVQKTDFLKMLWRLLTALIILASAIESAKTTNKSEQANICSTSGCEDAAKLLKANMDEKEEPCNDFFKFACGGFLKSASIPDGEPQTGQLQILQRNINTHIKEILEEKVDPSEPRIFELAKNYYRSCMDESARQKNLETLKNIIKQLGGWHILEGSKWKEEGFDLFEFDRKIRKLGYVPNSIFRIHPYANLLDTSQSFLTIHPPEPLIKAERISGAFMHPTVQAYHKYMTEVAVLLGADRKTAKIYLRKVIEFEKLLITGIKQQRIIDNMNPGLVSGLYEKYTSDFPWLEYINDMIEPVARFNNNSIINVLNPSYIEKVVYTLERTPTKTVSNYMIWKVIADSIAYLPNEFREVAYEFRKISSEKEVPPLKLPRWRQCVKLLTHREAGLGVAVSAMYIRKYCDDAIRKQVEPLMTAVAGAFKETINKTAWMSTGVKLAALDKLEMMRRIIAYPDELLNNAKIDEYSRSLNISSNDHFQNFLNLERFHYEFDLLNLGQSAEVNRWEFFSDSTTVNAYYYSLANTFVILAAILQRPLFNPEWPSYATFGSMGFMIGHEIMHAYDLHRILYDSKGAMNNWLSGEDKNKFINRIECFVNQYNEYVDQQAGLNLNGRLTVNENVADTGGLKIAYRAYRNWVEKHGEDPRPAQLQKYTADQLFFVNAVNFLCSKSTKAKRIDDVKTNTHTSDDFRALGMLSNSQEFAKAYSCPAKSTMNPDGEKCAVWE